jgi:hypothetical protein
MQNLITMNALGRMGRFGNQVFQYMFLRVYAKRYGLTYQCPRWIGQLLCGHDDPLVSESLPTYHEVLKPPLLSPAALTETLPPEGDEVRGHDYCGYAQPHVSYYRPDREFIRDLFQLNPKQSRLDAGVTALRQRGATVIGLHMRRGDTGRYIFYLTPNQWYLDWLAKNWSRFDNPVLFIASEENRDAAAFAEYNPVTSADLLDLSIEPYRRYNYLECELNTPTPVSMDWLPDWYFLTQCNVLAIGNSTFSFSAAMMARNLRECWRSRLSTQTFERIDPWDALPIVREDLRDWPNIPGTSYDNNPKWIGGEVAGRD